MKQQAWHFTFTNCVLSELFFFNYNNEGYKYYYRYWLVWNVVFFLSFLVQYQEEGGDPRASNGRACKPPDEEEEDTRGAGAGSRRSRTGRLYE